MTEYGMMLLGIFGCLGYCFLVNIPKRCILATTLVGGASWSVYLIFFNDGSGKVFAAFAAAALVGLLSDILSRFLKEAATIFIIPGIIPLVPGAGLYYTMIEIVNGNYEKAASIGGETFFVAGAIALALLFIGSLTRIFHQIKYKLRV
ncbi:MAG: threonine/serine exporter family protein [Anaerovoracaceae bacterium]